MSTARALAEQHHQKQLQKLQQQLNACHTNFSRARQEINELTKKLRRMTREVCAQDITHSPTERIYLDILKNHGRDPNGRRYSLDTLTFAQEIHAISPHALDFIRRVLPLPGESLLNSKFATKRRFLSSALENLDRVGELIPLAVAGAQDPSEGRKVILAVDAVAFRPVVTMTENGEIRGLRRATQLGNDDLFAHFLRNPRAFAEFLQAHWKDAYSNLFVFHIQPVHPAFPCTVIHAYPAESGKGNETTVRTLEKLRNIREVQ